MKIKEAINDLEAGGSTAGGEGIQLAYKVAKDNFIKEGNNRIILATDGDFNVGVSSDDELVRLIENERKVGYFFLFLVMAWETIRIIKCNNWLTKEMAIILILIISMRQEKFWSMNLAVHYLQCQRCKNSN